MKMKRVNLFLLVFIVSFFLFSILNAQSDYTFQEAGASSAELITALQRTE